MLEFSQSSSSAPCRLILDAPQDGAWNMAADEALLKSAASRQVASLRFYTWANPTLSLGYFQSHADRRQHTSSTQCPMVRRCSGGGAILHHHELTYSFVVPCTDRFLARPQELYSAFHETLVELLGQQGVAARLYSEQMPESEISAASLPFLCFQRRAEGDVLVGEHKIGGSAQRRRSAALLQHGSVLLRTSRCAPELKGLRELTGSAMQPDGLLSRWSERLASRLRLVLTPASLSDEEQNVAGELVRSRFEHATWTRRR